MATTRDTSETATRRPKVYRHPEGNGTHVPCWHFTYGPGDDIGALLRCFPTWRMAFDEAYRRVTTGDISRAQSR